jgi:hypothetical protein
MRQLAKDRGGMCLSERYLNSATKLLWKCSHGHVWKAAPRHIKEGRWCPICNRRQKVLGSLDKSSS